MQKMTKDEYLYTCMDEECAEVIQAVKKLFRFGPNNHHPDKPSVTNKEAFTKECLDVLTIFAMLGENDLIVPMTQAQIDEHMENKQKKVLEYYEQHKNGENYF